MGNPVDRSFQPSDSEVNDAKEKRQNKHDCLVGEIDIDPCCDYPEEFYEDYIAKFQKNKKKRRFFRFVKRSFDIVASFIGLTLLLPVFLIIAVAIKIDSRGPVFFKQKRVGRHGRLFNCYKFRSMHVEAPKNRATSLLGNPEQYVTRVGRFLRKFSLDELPQLYCCLLGTMSLIGPRPLIPEEKGCNSMRERRICHASRYFRLCAGKRTRRRFLQEQGNHGCNLCQKCFAFLGYQVDLQNHCHRGDTPRKRL